MYIGFTIAIFHIPRFLLSSTVSLPILCLILNLRSVHLVRGLVSNLPLDFLFLLGRDRVIFCRIPGESSSMMELVKTDLDNSIFLENTFTICFSISDSFRCSGLIAILSQETQSEVRDVNKSFEQLASTPLLFL